MSKKHPNVTHLNEIQPRVVDKGKFGFTGKQAFPNHYHCANEEGVYIIEGTGEARIGNNAVTVGPGDYIAYPVGPEHSHSLKNIGQEPLRYLYFSTMHLTEVVAYPDSKKFGVVGLSDPQIGPMGAKVKFIIKDQPSVDYYEGE